MYVQVTSPNIDKQLKLASSSINVTQHLQPKNVDEQKELFLNNKIQNPTFKYESPKLDFTRLKKSIRAIKIPRSHATKFYEEKKEEILLDLHMLETLGTKKIRYFSEQKYGRPSNHLIKRAIEILKRMPTKRTYRYKNSHVVKQNIQDLLQSHGLKGWTVMYSKKYLTTVYPQQKTITICQNRKFTKTDPNRLAVHEVGVHAIRAYNGENQPFKIFETGLQNYLSTEEGLAFFCEQITESITENHYRNYAGRVISVASTLAEHNFRTTYKILLEHGFSEEDAWNLALRGHRGGGYIKDHVYLDGYFKVRDLYLNTNDLMYLYVGKIGIQHIPYVKRLVLKGVLNKPKTLPLFLKELAT